MPLSMGHHSELVRTILIAVALFALLLVWSPGAGAGSDSSASDATVEGIVVHGDWTIDVHDPDGTLVSQAQFENALTTGPGSDRGALTLANLVAGNRAAIGWSIRLLSSDPPCLYNDGPIQCAIVNASYREPLESQFDTLVVSVEDDKVFFRGNAVAMRDGSIERVRTHVLNCGFEHDPLDVNDRGSCAAGVEEGLTQKWLPEAISVVEGQQISVTVEISFE